MRMSSRFIKNRLVDFGMIKSTEFLNLFFCHVYFVCYFGRMYVFFCFASNHLDQNWLYQGFHEWVQEGEQAEGRSSLSSEFVFTSGTDVQYLDNPVCMSWNYSSLILAGLFENILCWECYRLQARFKSNQQILLVKRLLEIFRAPQGHEKDASQHWLQREVGEKFG